MFREGFFYEKPRSCSRNPVRLALVGLDYHRKGHIGSVGPLDMKPRKALLDLKKQDPVIPGSEPHCECSDNLGLRQSNVDSLCGCI